MRPQNLARVAEMTRNGDLFGRCLANFLDGFYAGPSAEALAQEPPLLREISGDGPVWDAYLAATAEELARGSHLAQPAWIWSPDRALRRPWFASDLQSLRAVLLMESPAGFRSRNLFVSENALSRV
jgi:hypothetical protein